MDLVTQTFLWDDFRNVMFGDFLVYLTAKTFEGSGAESNYLLYTSACCQLRDRTTGGHLTAVSWSLTRTWQMYWVWNHLNFLQVIKYSSVRDLSLSYLGWAIVEVKEGRKRCQVNFFSAPWPRCWLRWPGLEDCLEKCHGLASTLNHHRLIPTWLFSLELLWPQLCPATTQYLTSTI